MLLAIRSGLFHPDRTRSGMMTPVGMAQAAPLTPFGRGLAPLPATPQPAPLTPFGRGVPPVHVESLQEKAEKIQSEIPLETQTPLGEWEAVDDLFGRSPVPAEEDASPADIGNADSETTEDDSVQSSSESEEDGEQDARHFNYDPPSDFYINVKSLVVHCCRNPGVLKCGRRVTPNFSKVYELNGIRCSRCFDV